MGTSVLALLSGLWAGLGRLGWPGPTPGPALLLAHGPLMVSGFLGTLVALERAVALGGGWTYAAPTATGLGSLALLVNAPWPAAPGLMMLGSLGLAAVFAFVLGRQPGLFAVIMELGALSWAVGNGIWLAGRPVSAFVGWYAGFLVLTIVGERLELSRLVQLPRASRAVFLAALLVYLVGLVVTTATPSLGGRLTGIGLVGMAAWLLRSDIARYAVRQSGLTRFIGASLLCGYVWLGVGGVLWVWLAGSAAGPAYDAMLHAVFLGFVFGMVFAHAPIILPAVLGGTIPFQRMFYGPVVLLNLSLIVRLAGDLGPWPAVRRWGGLLGVLAVLWFLANTLRAVRRQAVGRREDSAMPHRSDRSFS